MNHRENMLAVLEGRSPERIPWAPRLGIWYNAHRLQGTLPERYKGWSLRQIERSLNAAHPARDGRVFRKEIRDVDIEETVENNSTLTVYHTPAGSVSTRSHQTPELAAVGIIGLEVERLIKGPQDYRAAEYLIEHTAIIPTYEEYLAYEQEIGDDGMPIVPIGQDPMSSILWDLIGMEQVFYHLQDYPEKVEHLLNVLTEKAQEIQQVVLLSPARLFLHGEHFDSAMTPARLFEKYMLPYFKPFSDNLHQHGKYLACHADADTSRLLELIKAAGFDLAECFITAPMVRVTLEQARAAWGKQVIIWGGIPSTLLCDPVSDVEFEAYLQHMFRVIAPGDAIILGVADNVVPEAKIERIERISSLINEIGEYPVRIGIQ